MMTIKKGSKVKILCGKDKNKEGDVIEIQRSKNKIGSEKYLYGTQDTQSGFKHGLGHRWQ